MILTLACNHHENIGADINMASFHNFRYNAYWGNWLKQHNQKCKTSKIIVLFTKQTHTASSDRASAHCEDFSCVFYNRLLAWQCLTTVSISLCCCAVLPCVHVGKCSLCWTSLHVLSPRKPRKPPFPNTPLLTLSLHKLQLSLNDPS